MGSHPRNIWIDNDLWDAAAELSRETGVSRGKIVNTALNIYLTNTSTSSTTVQMDAVTATSPTHRPAAIKPEIRSEK